MLNSPVDIAIIFGVALLVFGPKKLPELGKALGQGIGNFKRSLQEAQDEVKSAVHTDEPEGGAEVSAAPRKEGAPAATSSAAGSDDRPTKSSG